MREEECSGPAPSNLKGVNSDHMHFDVVRTREVAVELVRSASTTWLKIRVRYDRICECI